MYSTGHLCHSFDGFVLRYIDYDGFVRRYTDYDGFVLKLIYTFSAMFIMEMFSKVQNLWWHTVWSHIN